MSKKLTIEEHLMTRGVSAVLYEITNTLENKLIPTPEGSRVAATTWTDFAPRIRKLARSARGIESELEAE